jgi:hypothetical protein
MSFICILKDNMRLPFLSKSFILFFVVFIKIEGYSQVQKKPLLQNYHGVTDQLKNEINKGELAYFNKNEAAQFLKSSPDTFHFIFEFEGKEWELVLQKNNILSTDFFVTTGKNPNTHLPYQHAILCYKGFIKGSSKSFAAVSIMADRMIAVIADVKGNINIGEVNTAEAKQNGEHIIYREADLLGNNTDKCGAAEQNLNTSKIIPSYNNKITNAAVANPIPVKMYFEADYDLYQHNDSSVTNTVNYVTALFNVVNTLYQNESINILLNSIKVWDIPDPYTSYPTMQAIIPVFSSNMGGGFTGDLAHLLTYRNVGGGISYLDVLCSAPGSRVALSGSISNAITSFPTYSRSVLYIAHEIGHNLGSPHTHSCSWPGGAIDNCSTPEGTCSPGPAPINGGTIMSYCQTTNYGTNFLNGFGPLPGNLLRNKLSTTICLNPSIYFSTATVTAREDEANIEAGCYDYKIYTVDLKITKPPSQPAYITLVPTALNGLIIGPNKDVEILSPLTFTFDSTHLVKTMSFKVFNDDIIEPVERINFAINLNSNGGDAVIRTGAGTFSLLIVSDDHIPDVTLNQIILNENFDTITTGLGNWTQTVVYGSASPNRWVMGTNADAEFPSKAAYISNNGSSLGYSGSTITDSTIVRLESPSINTMGFTAISLQFLLKVAGELLYQPTGPNTGVTLFEDVGTIYYSVDGGANWIPTTRQLYDYTSKLRSSYNFGTDANNRTNFKFAFEWRNNSSVVKLPALIIDSIQLKGTSVAPIQTVPHAHNFNEAYVGTNDTVHFYNPDTKNIIATIENNSSFDFGCTTLELLRIGNGATQAYDAIPSNQISEKVFRLTTSNNNTAANYRIKLYFTAAEINGWQQATGNYFTDVRVVKSTNNLSLPNVAGTPQFSSLNSNKVYGAFGSYVFGANFYGVTNSATFALMKPHQTITCADTIVIFRTTIPGTNYQWQVKRDSGFVNINADSIYSNTHIDSLKITNAANYYYGNIYRCQITTAFGITYSEEFILKSGMLWTGSVSNAWEDPLNWSCDKLPDEKTDVTILANTPFTPILNSVTTIKSLTAFSSSEITIKPGAVLNILKP